MTVVIIGLAAFVIGAGKISLDGWCREWEK